MALLTGSAFLAGATLSYSGNFPAGNPNALFEVNFTMSTTADLTISTSTIAHDGFQGVLWLFNSVGMQLAKDDPPVDTEAMISLPGFSAGTYEVILSAFDQHYCLANTDCNGVVYGNTGWSYNGDFGSDNLNYAFTVNTSAGTLTENSTELDPSPTRAFPLPTPEPASAALFLTGGALLCLRLRRQRAR